MEDICDVCHFYLLVVSIIIQEIYMILFTWAPYGTSLTNYLSLLSSIYARLSSYLLTTLSKKVDLPIFTIHGNHDDPTRDGSSELLSPIDLLSVSNLLNYFGRQDAVDNVQISPILLQKGGTKVALYGMGSMRDERLNRMWQGKKVRFLRPEQDISGDNRGGRGGNDDDDDEDDDGGRDWFNIFTLHQNRDLGRGSKNCVHESMIPEWMDLVVWGHEHECNIEPSESLVGTFRVTQPGSSVATSLTAGEARRKQVGVLDIRGQQFRLLPVPLSSVRAFAVGDVNLGEVARSQGGVLDVEDPKVEERMGDVLAGEVEALVCSDYLCRLCYNMV